MDRVKILFIIRQAEFGGAETHIKYIFESLNRELFTPVLVSLKEGFLSDFAKSMGIKFYLLRRKKYMIFWNIFNLVKIIKSEGIKFVHAHGTKAALLILIPALLTKKKFIYTVHSWSFHSKIHKINFLIRKLLEKIICQFTYLVIFVSEADFILGKFVRSDKKILIKNGVDISRFYPIRSSTFRKENGFCDKDFVIGYFTRFTLQKNPLFVIELIKSLKIIEPILNRNFKLLMIGDGELKKQIANKVKKRNLESSVKILEPSYRIERYLNIIDCYVLPSFWEGMPYGILEAMSCGIPVIASDIPSVKEIIKSGENGFCEKIEIENFKKRIVELASDNHLYSIISSNARKTIEEKFDLKQSLIETIKIYEKLKINDRG